MGKFGTNTLLQNGTKNNPDVIKLQRTLNAQGYMGANGKPLDVDGIYGANTEFAVMSFQKANGLAVDGIVGKNTWSELGLTFDNAYEAGVNMGSPEIYGKGTYIEASFPGFKNGISIGNISMGISKIGGETKYAAWALEGVTADAGAGVSLDYFGANLEARLIKVECGVKIPIPFTDKSLFIGGEGNLFAVGFHSYVDANSGKIKVGASALIGTGITLCIVD